MEYKGTENYVRFINTVQMFVNGKPTGAFKATIVGKEQTDPDVIEITGTDFVFVNRLSYRICNELELEREQCVKQDVAWQGRLF